MHTTTDTHDTAAAHFARSAGLVAIDTKAEVFAYLKPIGHMRRLFTDQDRFAALYEQGWRLAEFENTGYAVFVRPVRNAGWFRRWDAPTWLVQVADVDTVGAVDPDTGRAGISAELGRVRPLLGRVLASNVTPTD